MSPGPGSVSNTFRINPPFAVTILIGMPDDVASLRTPRADLRPRPPDRGKADRNRRHAAERRPASNDDTTTSLLTVPWSKTPHRRGRDVIALEGAAPSAVLLSAPMLGSNLSRQSRGDGSGCPKSRPVSRRSTASPPGRRRSKRHVSMTISLAFLAPSLVKAAVDGRLPRGIGVARLFDAPVAWSRQQQMLWFAH